MKQRQPNILYLHSHDTGRYIQPYGHAVRTPRLQALAESGVLFRKAFSAAPTCAPSRAALLTGQAAHSAGMDGLTFSGFAIDCQQHLAHWLGRAGYVSALAGFQHVVLDSERDRLPYDRILPDDLPIEQRAAEWLARHPRDGRPFFLDVGFMETHRKGADFWRDTRFPIDPRYVAPPACFPDTPEVRLDWARYLASAATLDQKIGLVLDALIASHHAENTLILYTADHGLPFPGIKPNVTEEALSVGMILAGKPLGIAPGTVNDALVSQVDLFPTICELANIDKPRWVQGKSLLPLLHGQVERLHDAVFGEMTFHGRYDPQRSIRTDRYRLIERFDDNPRPGSRIYEHTDQGLTRELWKRAGWVKLRVPQVQLFDLFFDPIGVHNVAEEPNYRPIVAELRHQLRVWMRETGDRLLDGPIRLPGGRDFGLADDGSILALPWK